MSGFVPAEQTPPVPGAAGGRHDAVIVRTVTRVGSLADLGQQGHYSVNRNLDEVTDDHLRGPSLRSGCDGLSQHSWNYPSDRADCAASKGTTGLHVRKVEVNAIDIEVAGDSAEWNLDFFV